jgi:hypothetical protein
MAIKLKIKINDNSELRENFDLEYESSSQIKMCKYALLLATHILELVKYDGSENPIITEGFSVNEAWQKGKARMHDVRQIGFKIHKLARESENTIIQNALRVVGHSVVTGHMKEHAMVASDYAIKVVNLLYPNDIYKVTEERLWQINTLNSISEV